jgi:hypothetical protein
MAPVSRFVAVGMLVGGVGFARRTPYISRASQSLAKKDSKVRRAGVFLGFIKQNTYKTRIC